jgi:signal transduction histidine kinase
MKLIIDRNITFGFGFALLALLLLAFLSYQTNRNFKESSSTILKSNAILYSAEEVKSVLTDIETGQRGFIITGDSAFLDTYLNALGAIEDDIAQLEALLEATDFNTDRIDELKHLIRLKNEFTSEAIAARTANFERSQKIIASKEGKEIMDQVRRIVHEIQAEARQLGEDHREARENAMNQFNFISISVVLTAVVLLSVLFILLNRSMGHKVKTENQIRQLNTELEAFSYSVSHDLRSPLRVIDGYASILHEDYHDKLDAEGKSVVDIIVNNARRMGQLIDDLLDFSHMSRKQISRSHISFEDLVSKICHEQKKNMGLDHVQFRIEPLESAYADLKMMEQVWTNLISNAVKYSSKQEAPFVTIGSERHNGDTCFFVKDNGVGFDMEYKDKLFGVFQRLHKAEEFPGTGVGLAIVKRIIARHGGTVWAESVPDNGATFYFTLPNNGKL